MRKCIERRGGKRGRKERRVEGIERRTTWAWIEGRRRRTRAFAPRHSRHGSAGESGQERGRGNEKDEVSARAAGERRGERCWWAPLCCPRAGGFWRPCQQQRQCSRLTVSRSTKRSVPGGNKRRGKCAPCGCRWECCGNAGDPSQRSPAKHAVIPRAPFQRHRRGWLCMPLQLQRWRRRKRFSTIRKR